MKDLKESRGSRAAAQDHGRPCHCGEDAFRVFDGFSFPVVFLSEDRRVVHANHAARTLFGFDGGTFEDGRFFKELGNINASSPVKIGWKRRSGKPPTC
jgi:PAS domain-containing protein